MSTLLLMNVAHDCSDSELQDWIESRGFEVESLKTIRDSFAGVSPSFAYVKIKDESRVDEAVNKLNGQTLHTRRLTVKAQPYVFPAGPSPNWVHRQSA